MSNLKSSKISMGRLILGGIFFAVIALLVYLSWILLSDFRKSSTLQTYHFSGTYTSRLYDPGLNIQLLSLESDGDVESIVLKTKPSLFYLHFEELWEEHLSKVGNQSVGDQCYLVIRQKNLSNTTDNFRAIGDFVDLYNDDFECSPDNYQSLDLRPKTFKISLLESPSASSLFPMDNRDVKLSFEILTAIVSTGKDFSPIYTVSHYSPDIVLKSFISDWQSDITFQKGTAINGPLITPIHWIEIPPGESTEVSIKLSRPLSIQVLTFVLVIGLTVFICFLVMVQDNAGALEIAVGILLGLWGIQEILVPESISGQTMIHFLIILLYLAFAAAVFVRFIYRPLDNHLKFRSSSEHKNVNEIGETRKVDETENPGAHRNHQLATSSAESQTLQESWLTLFVIGTGIICTLMLGYFRLSRKPKTMVKTK